MNISAFFERIGIDSDTKPEHNYEFLKKVQYAAVTSIPYENLDLIAKKTLSFKPDDIFQKVVYNHRGGYCFELNALLSFVYKELGFKVKDYLARYLRGEDSIPMRRHRVMTVELSDGEYLCDIGVGQKAPRYPLKIEAGLVQSQFGEEYKLEKDSELGWIVYDKHKNNWRAFFSFTNEKQYEVDFEQASYYFETHPNSKFNKDYIVAIKTPDGRKTLNGREFKVFSGETLLSVEENVSDKKLKDIMLNEFFIKSVDF